MVVDDSFATKSDKNGSRLLTFQDEDVVKRVFSSIDEAVNYELDRLHIEEGVEASCKSGCFQCCGHHILTNVAEAKTLTQYIRHKFSADQIEALKIRTQQWHKWDATRSVRVNTAQERNRDTFSTHQYCPMLVEGKCKAYPVRPLICRRHFVSSDPSLCSPFYDSESNRGDPVTITSIHTVTSKFSSGIKNLIETAGLNFDDSIMLLPHWLAIEMNWDFALSPENS